MNDPEFLHLVHRMREAQATPGDVAQMMARYYERQVNAWLDWIRAGAAA
ncbi:MAG: hypothetical protein AAF933_12420 [Pseudomonadota bacterium]